MAGMLRERRLIEQLLRKPDPRGYYVIPVAYRDSGTREAVEEILDQLGLGKVLVEEAGDTLYVLVKGRSLARTVIEKLLKKGFQLAPS